MNTQMPIGPTANPIPTPPRRDNVERACVRINAIFVLGWWLLVIVVWQNLPFDGVPSHFSGTKVDDWGTRNSFLLLPVLHGLTVALFSWAIANIAALNYPWKFSEANAAQQYTLMRKLLRILQINTTILFVGIAFVVHQHAHNLPAALGFWLIGMTFCIATVSIVTYLGFASKLV